MSQILVQPHLSGGSTNTNKDLSLGGGKSSTVLVGQTVTYVSASINGITLIDGCNITSGTLYYYAATKKIGFQKTGGAVPSGTQLDTVSANGKFLLICPEGDSYLSVNVVFASLPGTDASVGVTGSNIIPNLFKDVTEVDALNGVIHYRHLYLTNIYTGPILVTLWIAQNFTGLDYFEIGAHQLTSGTVDATLPDELTAPADVNFYKCASQSEGLNFSISTSGSCGFFLKRTVTALSDISSPSDIGFLRVAVSQ